MSDWRLIATDRCFEKIMSALQFFTCVIVHPIYTHLHRSLELPQNHPAGAYMEFRSDLNKSLWHFSPDCPKWPNDSFNILRFDKLPAGDFQHAQYAKP